MLFRTLSAAALLCVAGSASAGRWSDVHGLAPLYHLKNDAITDNFYTVSLYDRQLAISCCGYQDAGVAAWVPVTDGSVDPAAQGLGTLAYLPFMRFWKGAPENEHFYTTSPSEKDAVTRYGWNFEGYEGNLFSGARDGAQPLYRLYQFNPSTGDLAHFYTLSESARDSRVAAGWRVDGVEGHAYPAPTQQGSSWMTHSFSGSSLVVVLPGFKEIDPFTLSTDYACSGRMEVHVNGALRSVITDWSFGEIPGTFNTVGCYRNTWISIQSGYTYRVKLDFGGARANYTPAGSFQGIPKVIYPTTHSLTIRR